MKMGIKEEKGIYLKWKGTVEKGSKRDISKGNQNGVRRKKLKLNICKGRNSNDAKEEGRRGEIF